MNSLSEVAASASINPSAETAFLPDATPKRILLLEDDLELTSTLKDYLSSYGYDVTTVTNGADGLEAIVSSDFDFVVSDLTMPNLAGDLFYFAVQCARPQLCSRLVFITGNKDNPTINDFISLIGAPALFKPFQLPDLLGAVRSLDCAAA